MNNPNNRFVRFFDREPQGIAIAPGRVNLIGEHTDYNEGFALPVAIDRTITVAFAPRSDRLVHVLSLDFSQDDSFSLDAIDRLEGSPWANYVRAIAAIIQEAGYPLTGLDIAIQGDIPIGAGLSSSAALEVGILGAFGFAAGLGITPHDQAILAQRAENRFVGVNCGVMDQMASTMGRRDHALFIDCRTTETELVPLGLAVNHLKIVVAQTGVTRALSASAYNQRREECSETLRILSRVIAGRPLRALRDITMRDLELHTAALPERLAKRARHVVSENQRVLQSVQALREGDFAAFGALLYSSHESLDRDYEVSCPELNLMVNLASNVEGIVGARMTGAGFGGCTVNLVHEEATEAFRDGVIETYRTRTGLPGAMYVCQPTDGLRIIPVGGSLSTRP